MEEPDSTTVTAALVVIGEEILSGRTRDENIFHIAGYLAQIGISLREVRVVCDLEPEIVTAVNELRPRFTYVFTTGGIGPTHDDVTTDAIARAPGFMIGNVIVMAGVPRIMQVMLDAVMPRLAKGRPMLSRSVRIDTPEGDVAPGLSELQSAHPEVQIGSYPFFEKKRFGTYVVLRCTDEAKLAAAVDALWTLIAKERFPAVTSEEA